MEALTRDASPSAALCVSLGARPTSGRRSTIVFGKYDVERAEYRSDISEHVSLRRLDRLRIRPLGLRPRVQSDPLETVWGVPQYCQQRLRFARNLHFSNDLARLIHNADGRVLDRDVQSSKMVLAAAFASINPATSDLRSFIGCNRSGKVP